MKKPDSKTTIITGSSFVADGGSLLLYYCKLTHKKNIISK
jgi:hypothetical protein